MKRIHLLIFLVIGLNCGVQAQLDPESGVFTFPVNKDIMKAFALTDQTIKQLADLTADGINTVNNGEPIWYWIFVETETPSIDFSSETGLSAIDVYGPFSKEYLYAVDSVQNNLSSPVYSMSSQEGSSIDRFTIPSLTEKGLYLIELTPAMRITEVRIEPAAELLGSTKPKEVRNPPKPCIDCLNDELPEPGKYLVSAWAQETPYMPGTTNFTNPVLRVHLFYQNGTSVSYTIPMVGYVIDGWQLMEGEFDVLSPLSGITIILSCQSNSCQFDDVRMLPYDGSMKSYVFDPVNLRLAAELDERHYSTIYEYDEEGRLKRIKKETERGIMTIQETSTSSHK